MQHEFEAKIRQHSICDASEKLLNLSNMNQLKTTVFAGLEGSEGAAGALEEKAQKPIDIIALPKPIVMIAIVIQLQRS